jgi:anti-anti-sigma regulatory factor
MGEPHPRTVLVDVGALAPDGATVDAVARLHLEARRIGEEVVLCGASSDLRALLDLCGLTEVLRVEVGGEPEEREERVGVEEERELDDLAP